MRTSKIARFFPPNAVLALALLDSYSNKVASINVLKQNFDQPQTIDEFLAKSIASARSLPGYEEMEDRKINIEGFKTELLTFKATQEDQTHLFIQTYFYRVKDNIGYTVTATLDPETSKDVITETIDIMKSFKLK